MPFVSLHNHSDASLLDGLSKVDQIVAKAKEYKHPAVAITDHGNIFNAIHFYKACHKAGIKPILGNEFYFVPDVNKSRENKDRTNFHLVLLAENEEGWRNIVRMVTISNSPEAFYGKPRIDYEILRKHSDGIICLTACMQGIVPYHLLKEDRKTAYHHAKQLYDIFGDRLYFETQNAGLKEQYKLNQEIRQIAKRIGRPTVATVDSHYIEPEDALTHIELMVLSTHNREYVMGSGFAASAEFYFKDRKDIKLPKGELDRTLEVAERCNVEIDLTKHRFPRYPITEGNSEQLLRKKLNQGWQQRLTSEQQKDPVYKQRGQKEIKDIIEGGFADYFLIMADIINWAKKENIWIGPGRGSVAGSLLAYLLNITDINPIEHGLIFERFYNKGREQSAPDIDTDIELRYRKRVIDYITDRFGKDRVAQLMTLNTMAARAAIKDIMRINNIPFDEANEITKLIPAKGEEHTFITLKEALKRSPELKKMKEDKRYTQCFQYAEKIEGVAKSVGTHAAAVIIMDESFDDGTIPLIRAPGGHGMICGFDMKSIDDLNILKCDALGLATLEMLHRCYDLIKERHNIEILPDDIPMDDKATFDLIASGNVDGGFQIESFLGKKWSKLLMPRHLRDLSDLISLVRPGPMDCLSGDTKILVNKFYSSNCGRWQHEYKTVKQLYDDYIKVQEGNFGRKMGGPPQLRVCSIDENSLKIVRNKIKRVVNAGNKDVYNLSLIAGYGESRKQGRTLKISASLDHRFLTLSGWKKLKNITSDDYVCIVNKRFGYHRSNRYADGWRNFKNIAMQNYKYNCIFCNWKEGGLDVNHIEGNKYTNNDPDNLCFLCPNHHRVYTEGHLSKADLIRMREKFRLPVTDDLYFLRVKDIVKIDNVETYDIEMQDPYNNFIAGDFVVHNSGMLDIYHKVHIGEQEASYMHDSLEPILNSTHSTLCYQEQLLEICNKIAKMSLSESDKLRKIVGKKQPEEMKKWKNKFIKMVVKNNDDISQEVAETIWSWIEAFAGYGFNLSHSIAYATNTYRTMYYKVHYPVEFFCACLMCATYCQKPLEEIRRFVNDAKLFNIKVLPPDIRIKNLDFVITDDNTIRFGLSTIKHLGVSAIDKIKDVDFESMGFYDFLFDLDLNKQVVIALISSGALDYFDMSRDRMLNEFGLYKNLTIKQKATVKELYNTDTVSYNSIIDVVRGLSNEELVEHWKDGDIKPPNVRARKKLRLLVAEYEGKELMLDIDIIEKEKEYLGISTKPRIIHEKSGDKCINIKLNLPSSTPNIHIIGFLTENNVFLTKKTSEKMAFIAIEDSTYMLQGAVVFPKLYEKVSHLLAIDRLIEIRGRLDANGTLICGEILSV